MSRPSSSQRAAIAAEIEPLLAEENARIQKEAAAKGGRRSGETRRGEAKVPEKVREPSGERHARESVEQAAKLTGTNGRYVQDAKAVKAKAPDVFEKVREGKITVPEAKRPGKRKPRRSSHPAGAGQRGNCAAAEELRAALVAHGRGRRPP